MEFAEHLLKYNKRYPNATEHKLRKEAFEKSRDFVKNFDASTSSY